MKSPLAGNFVSQQLRLIFKQSQVPLTPHYMVASKTPVEAGAPAQAVYKKFDKEPHPSFRRLEEERVITEFKESVVQMWTGPGKLSSSGNEEVAKSSPTRPFEMPDGWNQVFGVERFKAAEGLFDAKAALTDSDNPRPRDDQTIPQLVVQALSHVDVEVRPALLANIVVTGGSSLMYGFTDRLNQELSAMYPGPRIRLQAPGPTVERKYASWIGGSILGSLGSFHQVSFIDSKLLQAAANQKHSSGSARRSTMSMVQPLSRRDASRCNEKQSGGRRLSGYQKAVAWFCIWFRHW